VESQVSAPDLHAYFGSSRLLKFCTKPCDMENV
jgi:hypothetical protein